jgi:putative addiction module killer protein
MNKRKATEYLDTEGVSPYGGWFNQLNAEAAYKVTTAVYRLELGNFSNVEPVGEGVSEYKIDFGPGYRIYFGMDGNELIILLGGGSKKRQNRDIENAKKYWRQYKLRKRKEK